MSGLRAGTGVLLAALLLGGCQESGDDGFMVDATGTIVGLAWLDRNGNGELEGSDGPAQDVRIDFVQRSGGAPVYTARTNSAGEFVLSDVMVGDYRAVVDSGSVGDSLRVLRVDSADVTVSADDTSTVLVGVTYPAVTIDSARAAELDQRLFVEGLVISEWNTYGDGSMHVRDTTGAIRILRVQPNTMAAGDSLRALATTSVQSGRAVLRDGLVFLLRTGVESPDPVDVNTGEAAGASSGVLDAELVRVEGAILQDTTRNSFGEIVLQVDDGSGLLDVVLDRDIPFFLNLPPDAEVLGAEVDATGILLPPESGVTDRWVLKPRENPDVTVRTQ